MPTASIREASGWGVVPMNQMENSTMPRSARDALSARFTSMEQAGLVDVKFLLRDLGDATAPAVFAEVEEMLRLHQEGSSFAFDFGDATPQ